MPRVKPECLDLPPPYLALLRELLARHVPAADVWAYGSRVSGGGHEASDLDLVLRNPQNLSQDVKGWGELKEALSDSHLPLLIEIHLWSHLPAAFHAEIERQYVVVQEGAAIAPASAGAGV